MRVLLRMGFVFGLALGVGCTSEKQQQSTAQQAQGNAPAQVQFHSDSSWVRAEPIDLAAIDANGDGTVYFCPMIEDRVWADTEGTCPVCRMALRAIPLEEARRKLESAGIAVR